MPLESAQYLNELEASNPAPSDQVRQGDDHIRLIKEVLQNTFPNITGPVEADQDSLNGLFSMPLGIITLWYGAPEAVPSGWAVCNGASVAKSDGSGNITVPDLRNKIVMGAGTTVAQGASAGALTDTATSSTGGAHTHTVPGVGAHTHTVTLSGTSGATAATVSITEEHAGSSWDTGGGSGEPMVGATATSPSHTHSVSLTGTTDSGSSGSGDSGSSGDHSHTVTVDTLPPVYGLHYIMKV